MKEITITKDNGTTHRLINSDFLGVEDHKSWTEQLEKAINSPSEIVPEINSQEDLDEWLSKGKVTINDFTKEELQSAFRTLDESRENRNYDKLKGVKLEGDKIVVDKCSNKD